MLVLASDPMTALDAAWANLLTPSPKEIIVLAAGVQAAAFDCGRAVTIDCVFLGFTNAEPGATWTVSTRLTEGDAWMQRYTGELNPVGATGRFRHGFCHFTAVSARYVQIAITNAAEFHAGVLLAGQAFIKAHEYGSGRGPLDTGTKEALPDGGFGIDPGVVKQVIRWRYRGLTDDQAERFMDLALDRGEGRPVLVVDTRNADPMEAAFSNNRLLYSSFDRFEPFERRDAADTSWACSATEWL